jgi:serine/threonine protein kinase
MGDEAPVKVGRNALPVYMPKETKKTSRVKEAADRVAMVVEKIIKKAEQRGVDPKAFRADVLNELCLLKDISGDTEIEEKLKEIENKITGNKLNSLANRVKKIGHGKSKDIWTVGDVAKATHIYSTPRGKGFLRKIQRVWTKKNELVGELEKVQALAKAFNTSKETYLSLDFQLAPSGEKKFGRYTLKSEKAEGSLETLVGDAKGQEFRLGENILAGLVNLQKAEYLHGDLKLDNVFLYKDTTGNFKARIADFGKTQKAVKDRSYFYSGNPRYAAPEWRLSQKSEVFSAGIMLIRLLEDRFLIKNKMMLIEPKVKKSLPVRADRKGIERFLSLSARCPQRDNISLSGQISIIGKRLAGIFLHRPKGLPKSEKNKFEKEVRDYIDELVECLKGLIPEKGKQFESLKNLLYTMTAADPNDRPDMSAALISFKALELTQ